MKEHIHRENTYKHTNYYLVPSEKTENKKNYNREKCEKSKNTSLDQLLDIPTFWYIFFIEVLFFLWGCLVIGNNVAIGRTRTPKSRSERMIQKSLYADTHTFSMTICRSSSLYYGFEDAREWDEQSSEGEDKNERKYDELFTIVSVNISK